MLGYTFLISLKCPDYQSIYNSITHPKSKPKMEEFVGLGHKFQVKKKIMGSITIKDYSKRKNLNRITSNVTARKG